MSGEMSREEYEQHVCNRLAEGRDGWSWDAGYEEPHWRSQDKAEAKAKAMKEEFPLLSFRVCYAGPGCFTILVR